MRKCGTCRYFADAEVACSGWCTHPDRGEIQQLVLVRRYELACRDIADADLWAPATDDAEAKVVSGPVPAADAPEWVSLPAGIEIVHGVH